MIIRRTSKIAVLLLTACALGPSTAASAPSRTAAATSSVESASVNINAGSVKDLMSLSGVGRRLAERIVEYREAHGPFKKPEDLRKVSGVGRSLWERNRNRIAVK